MTHAGKAKFYLIMTIIGVLVPSYFTLMFCFEKLEELGGFSVVNLLALSPEFYKTAFQHLVASQLLTDIIVCTLVFFFWMIGEGRRLGMKHLWIYPLCTYMIAFSFGMPLFMYHREKRLAKR